MEQLNNLTMEELINDLNELLKGRSNIIMKYELEAILRLYQARHRRISKDFWDIKIDRPFADSNNVGLIPKLWDSYLFKKQFTDKEWNDLEQIKKDSYINRIKELARELGKERAEQEFKRKR
jgi:hypothetical protein